MKNREKTRKGERERKGDIYELSWKVRSDNEALGIAGILYVIRALYRPLNDMTFSFIKIWEGNLFTSLHSRRALLRREESDHICHYQSYRKLARPHKDLFSEFDFYKFIDQERSFSPLPFLHAYRYKSIKAEGLQIIKTS